MATDLRAGLDSQRMSRAPRHQTLAAPLRAIVARPRLDERLGDLLTRRLAVVTGAAGYGKSTLVAAWAAGLGDNVTVAWCALEPEAGELRVLVEQVGRALDQAIDLQANLASAADRATTRNEADAIARAEGIAALLCDSLEAKLDVPLVLVVDDLHEIAGSDPAVRFIEAVVRGAPPDLHMVLTSRQAIGFPIERLRGQGQVVEITPDQLLFDARETEELLAGLRPPATDLLDPVMRLTGGWPAMTRLVLEALRSARPDERTATLARIREPEGPLLSYLAEEVLGQEPPETLEVLRVASRFERVLPDMLVALGVTEAPAVMQGLARRAFLVESRTEAGSTASPAYILHDLIRDYALRNLPLEAAVQRDLHARAARWWDTQGRRANALRHRLVAGESASVAACLVECGLDLVREGELDLVVAATTSLPEAGRDPAIEIVFGDALLRRGEWDGAMAAFDRAGGGAPILPAALAWRIALIQHERGDVVSALATYARADMTTGDPADRAQVAAWRAICMWQREELEEARANAELAIAIAERSGSDQALAAANAAAGAVAHMDGETQVSLDSFRKAIRHSERTGDVLMEVRFRTDLGYVLTFGGRYAESLEELDRAVARGAALGHSSFLALAMSDRGQAHLALGHVEEAEADFAEARRLYELLGSTWIAYPTLKQANIHQLRGETAVARVAYRDVIANAEALYGAWFLAEAILGLAAATVEDDPDEALRLVEEAMDRATAVTAASTPLGAARVALAAGRTDLAVSYAEQCRRIAERRRDRPSLAGALEIEAQTSTSPERARTLLHEAEAIWLETGSPVGLALHELIWAEVVGGPDGRTAALHAAETFRQMGASQQVDRATMLADRLAAADRPAVEIRALGPFQVLRGGQAIPLLEWQSKKARDLLKVLVTRRGRATTREALCELLWPDEEPGPLLNRLSVALATIRSVLDPGRRHPMDHFIRADKASVSLDLDHVAVDLEAFLSGAGQALRGLEAAGTGARGRATGPEDVHGQLAAVEAAYRGDFLEEDPYAEWTRGVRDEARETYLSVARALATRAGANHDADNAVRLYLRILDHDPYDEDAHLGLVDVLAVAGRHGEARRRYGVYTARMEELDLEAASYPAVRGRPPDARRDVALSPA